MVDEEEVIEELGIGLPDEEEKKKLWVENLCTGCGNNEFKVQKEMSSDPLLKTICSECGEEYVIGRMNDA